MSTGALGKVYENGEVLMRQGESGDGMDEIPMEYAGGDLTIGFNAKYFLDVLAALDDCEEVALGLSGELDPGVLRPGNVHSAHGWREVLDPVVAQYRGQDLRRLLRGNAAFALPEVYEWRPSGRLQPL